MQSYQIRFLDSGGLDIVVHDRQCSGDHEAMALAKSLADRGGIAHIWQDLRNVGQIYVPLPVAAE